MERGNVDLRTCEKGDILISALGAELRYVRPTINNEHLDHLVEYCDSNLGEGTRTDDGYAFKHNRIPSKDHDIVKIFKLRTVTAIKNANLKYKDELAFVKANSNDVLLQDYSLTDMLWYMKHFHENMFKITSKG